MSSISSLSPRLVLNMEIHGLGMPPNPRSSSPDLTKEVAEVPDADAQNADDDVRIEASSEELDALDVAARDVSAEEEGEVSNNEEADTQQNREEVRAQTQRRTFTRYSEKMKDVAPPAKCCECYQNFFEGHNPKKNAEEWEKQRDLWYEGKTKECCIQGLNNRKRWCESLSVSLLVDSGCALGCCATAVGSCASGIVCTGCGLISCVCCSTSKLNEVPCCLFPCCLGVVSYGYAGVFCSSAALIISACVVNIFRLPANLCCSECMSLAGQHALDYRVEQIFDLCTSAGKCLSKELAEITGSKRQSH